MEDLRGLCAAAPTFVGAATSPLAEVVASVGKCVNVVAKKRFALAQDEHGHCIVAVSYTHLDVYKRQELSFVLYAYRRT